MDDYIAARQFDEAAAVLQEFSARIARHTPSLLKLIEVCVDGGLESTMYEAQTQLTDAYLESGQATEARVVAEDLIAREPWEKAHIERFRRALVMLRVDDPDSIIAERLSGQSPFMANDPFMDLNDPEPEPAPAPAPDVAAVEAAVAELRRLLPSRKPLRFRRHQRRKRRRASSCGEAPAAAAAPVPARAARGKKAKPASETAAGEIDLTSALGGLSDDDEEEIPRRRNAAITRCSRTFVKR